MGQVTILFVLKPLTSHPDLLRHGVKFFKGVGIHVTTVLPFEGRTASVLEERIDVDTHYGL
jgi:hypothetical protein